MRRLATMAAVGVLGLGMTHGRSACAQPAQLVAPESLEQGFILLVTDKSGLAGASSPIYLASNHVGWNPGDNSMRLEARSDGRWQIVLDKPASSGPLEFKFTRGTWDSCEVASNLDDIANRQLPQVNVAQLGPGERPVIELTIEHFADERPEALARKGVDPYRRIDATGEVRRLQVSGGGGGAADMTRDVLVWLPPGCHDPANADRRYPVLYLQDGQNIFEQLPGVPGEWHADETATELIGDERIEPIIIVGIPHAGRFRTTEYLPEPAFGIEQPGGDEYVEFLVTEVMPRVERSFPVSTDRKQTAIGGSSLGAVISLHAMRLHPDRFGMLLLESTAIIRDLDQSPLWEDLAHTGQWPAKVYIGVGTREAGTGADAAELNAMYVRASERLDELFARAGVDSDHRMLVETEGAVHNEDAWASRLPTALEFLFAP